MEKSILGKMIQKLTEPSRTREPSSPIGEANTLFDIVNGNRGATPEQIFRLMQLDASIVDSIDLLSPLDSGTLPGHIEAVIGYFRDGEGLSSCYPSNLAAAIYFSMIDIYGNHWDHNSDSIGSVEQHLRRLSGTDPTATDVHYDQDGAQLLMDNQQGRPVSKYLLYNRGFSNQYIYEVIITERTRDLDITAKTEDSETNYTIFANVFIVVRKRNGSDIVAYATSYYAESSIHLLGLNSCLCKELGEFIQSFPAAISSGAIMNLTVECGNDTDGVSMYDGRLNLSSATASEASTLIS